MNEGQRLREHLRRVGEVKSSTRAEDDAMHAALAPSERLRRVVELSDALRALSISAARSGSAPDDADVWLRVYRHLHRGAHG